MNRAQKVKSIVKRTGEKPTFGTDPKDPWSAKANIAEDAALNTYLKSRGINPEFATKDQKVAHSKTGQFIKWKRDHMLEDVDKKDTVTLDIPLLIRVLELAREDIKSDMDLHRVVERLINMRTKGMLTMDDYDAIAAIKEDVYSSVSLDHIKQALDELVEELEQIDELSKDTLTKYKTYATLRAVGHASNIYDREVEGGKSPDPAQHAKLAKVNKGLARADVRLKKEEVVDESMSTKKEDKIKQLKQDHATAVHWSKNDTNPHKRESARQKAEKIKNHLQKQYNFNVSEAKEANYGGEYQSAALRVKELAKKKPVDMKSLAARMQASYAKDKKQGVAEGKEETVSEVAPPGFEGTVKAMKKYKGIDNPFALAWSMKNKGYKSHKKADGSQKNENYQDPMAADSMPCSCGTNPDDVEKSDKGKKLIQMSKSARIIKSIYNRKGMKEETYDWEKEDKSVATYGKKPKIQKATQASSMEKPQAAAIMTGGTTLTGEKRDTIEIDPMMKMRKPDSGKR